MDLQALGAGLGLEVLREQGQVGPQVRRPGPHRKGALAQAGEVQEPLHEVAEAPRGFLGLLDDRDLVGLRTEVPRHLQMSRQHLQGGPQLVMGVVREGLLGQAEALLSFQRLPLLPDGARFGAHQAEEGQPGQHHHGHRGEHEDQDEVHVGHRKAFASMTSWMAWTRLTTTQGMMIRCGGRVRRK